jgi:hypothetical protein
MARSLVLVDATGHERERPLATLERIKQTVMPSFKGTEADLEAEQAIGYAGLGPPMHWGNRDDTNKIADALYS